jgi:hypothetical protein
MNSSISRTHSRGETYNLLYLNILFHYYLNCLKFGRISFGNTSIDPLLGRSVMSDYRCPTHLIQNPFCGDI